MVRQLIHDPILLATKSETATKKDLLVARDLLDTLMAHKDTCVGMAANMIGEKKRIIAFLDESGPKATYTMMLNPEIIQKALPFETEEGCVSLLGGPRPCHRFRMVEVRYQDEKMQIKVKKYFDFTAQIVQHEIDHCNGILI